MKKIDVILALVTGEVLAWFFYGFLKDYIKIEFLGWILAILMPILAIIGLWISWVLGKRYLFIFQAAKFLLIGALATLIDLGVFKFLDFTFMGTALTDMVFKGISFLVATFAKYWGDKFWAFEKMEKTKMGMEITQFYIVTVIGLGINVGVFSLIVTAIGPQFGIVIDTWKTISVLTAAIIVAVWNFLGYKFIVFKS